MGYKLRSPETQCNPSNNGSNNVFFVNGNYFWHSHRSVCRLRLWAPGARGVGMGQGLLRPSVLLCWDRPRAQGRCSLLMLMAHFPHLESGWQGAGSCLDFLCPHVTGPCPSEHHTLLNSRQTHFFPDVRLQNSASTPRGCEIVTPGPPPPRTPVLSWVPKGLDKSPGTRAQRTQQGFSTGDDFAPQGTFGKIWRRVW